MDTAFLTQLLTTVMFQLPLLLIYVVGLALLATRRPSRPRTLGISGLVLLLLVAVWNTMLSMLPIWLTTSNFSFASFSAVFFVLRAMSVLMSVAGMLLMVLALRFALPPR